MARGALLASESESAWGITRRIQVVVRAGFHVVEPQTLSGVVQFSALSGVTSISKRNPG